jgi:purine-binding chemotaxis protein CheW
MSEAVARRAAQAASNDVQHLVFYVSGRALGVSLRFVSEILPYEQVSGVPGLPSAVRGVVHVRGRMVPVLDAATRLGLVPEPPTKRTCIVMMEVADGRGARRSYGLTADRVSTLLDVDASRIQPVPDFGLDLEVRFLEGLYQMDKVAVPLIAPGHLFDLRELERVQAAVRDEGGVS